MSFTVALRLAGLAWQFQGQLAGVIYRELRRLDAGDVARECYRELRVAQWCRLRRELARGLVPAPVELVLAANSFSDFLDATDPVWGRGTFNARELALRDATSSATEAAMRALGAVRVGFGADRRWLWIVRGLELRALIVKLEGAGVGPSELVAGVVFTPRPRGDPREN